MRALIFQVRIAAILPFAVSMSCSVSDSFEAPEVVTYGAVELEKEAKFSATLVENEDRFSEDYPYGIDFEYKLDLAETTTLMITESHSYSCDFGVSLLGPSYYLYKDGKQVAAYDYLQRSVYPTYPLLGVPQFPGTIEPAKYKLRVRFMADGECSPSGGVTVHDRYSPKNNQPMVLHAGLLGTWTRENEGVTTSMTLSASGSAVQTVSSAEQQLWRAEYSAFNFPQDDQILRMVLQVRTITVTEGVEVSMPLSVGEVYYCIYDLGYVEGRSQFAYECSPANKPYFPSRLSEAAEKLRG